MFQGTEFLITVLDYIIIDTMDDGCSATESLLGEGRKRGKGRRQEDSNDGGDSISSWGALKAFLGLSQCLTSAILCYGGQ